MHVSDLAIKIISQAMNAMNNALGHIARDVKIGLYRKRLKFFQIGLPNPWTLILLNICGMNLNEDFENDLADLPKNFHELEEALQEDYKTIPAPLRLHILKLLMNLTYWSENSLGARVVLTGTAHAKFVKSYLINGMNDWIEFVGPLPEDIFDSLLKLHPTLGDGELCQW
ncbi:hypothetical protein RhiirB3_427369 [Rhizophagus irregularis]|nr:hypothetical protein RhiirB3_427369 [Rhizophagus irregularis]